MSYLTRECLINTCKAMQQFYEDLCFLYQSAGLDITEDVGRRNMMMSSVMEHCLAEQIKKLPNVKEVLNDGKTGQPDILVTLKNGTVTELECKLTSPHKSGSIALQSDYETLKKKGELDYIYIVADRDFKAFTCVYFEKLDIHDFRNQAPGSRGKVQLKKYVAMKKATVFVGKIENRNLEFVKNLQNKIKLAKYESENKISTYMSSLNTLSTGQISKRKSILETADRLKKKTEFRLNKLEEKINLVKSRNASYKFLHEEL